MEADERAHGAGLHRPCRADADGLLLGSQFPASYRGDAFVAMRGSWNRKPASGYEIVRIHFESGKPTAIDPVRHPAS